jgi:hypothetical protein
MNTRALSAPLASALVFCLAAALAGTAHAEYNCVGHVEQIATRGGGGVSLISTEMFGDGNGRDICSLQADWKGVTPSTCRGWVAQALAAKSSGSTLRIQYTDAYTCPSQPVWSSASSPWAIFSN